MHSRCWLMIDIDHGGRLNPQHLDGLKGGSGETVVRPVPAFPLNCQWRAVVASTILTGNLISLTIYIRLSLLPVNPLQATAQVQLFFHFGVLKRPTFGLSLTGHILHRFSPSELLGHRGSLSPSSLLPLLTHKEDVWISELAICLFLDSACFAAQSRTHSPLTVFHSPSLSLSCSYSPVILLGRNVLPRPWLLFTESWRGVVLTSSFSLLSVVLASCTLKYIHCSFIMGSKFVAATATAASSPFYAGFTFLDGYLLCKTFERWHMFYTHLIYPRGHACEFDLHSWNMTVVVSSDLVILNF